MQGDLLSALLLPLMLGFIMFSLGLGLQMADFRRIAGQPRAFLVGFFCHFVLLPLACFSLLLLFPLPPALAVGFMIIAACPTGTTSNLLTYMARGDVALAVSFTAAASIVTIFTVPLIVGGAMAYFMGVEQQVNVPAGQMMAQILLMLGLPVSLGMLARAFKPAAAIRWEPLATRIATILFVLIVLGVVLKNWRTFEAQFWQIAPLAIALNLSMLAAGFLFSRLAKLERRQAVTVAIETAVQNATLAIVIGSSILKQDEMAMPGAIYGVLMYVGGLAFAYGMRRTAGSVSATKH